LERCRALGLLKARGQQRTASTHVLAAIRVLNRLELVAETLRAALNTLATVAPDWLQGLAPLEWYERYGKRIEDTRLPREQAKRDAYAHTVGADGFRLLDALDAPEAPEGLQELPSIRALRQTWQRHYERSTGDAPTSGHPAVAAVRFTLNRELPPAAEGIESPYDPEARYRHKRDTQWTGYMVHVSETCEPTAPPLLTQVYTTPATVHEVMCTDAIEQALVAKALPPGEHLVDAASTSAELFVSSRQAYGIELRGPTRQNTSWQTKGDGAYSLDQFTVDWERQEVWCPQGKRAVSWTASTDHAQKPCVSVQFSRKDCTACPTRTACTRAQHKARSLQLPPREHYEALQAMRAWYASAEGQRQYARRAGIEGTLSQGVRAFGLRRARYRGLEKTQVQHVATAAAINIDRTVAWLDKRPRAATRTSRFAALAPACGLP
jgi:transposase